MLDNEDLAQAAIRILYDCPPEIALVVEVVVREWAAKATCKTTGEGR